jgi:hypothetical protein
VTVLRVFTDSDRNFGSPLGLVDTSQVERGDRQQYLERRGYQEPDDSCATR